MGPRGKGRSVNTRANGLGSPAPDGAGQLSATPMVTTKPRTLTRGRGAATAGKGRNRSIIVSPTPALDSTTNDEGDQPPEDSEASSPPRQSVLDRMSTKNARDLIKYLTDLAERAKRFLKDSDKWIEGGVLSDDHSLPVTQMGLQGILDLFTPKMKKFEAARQKCGRVVSTTTYTRVKDFMVELNNLATMEAGDLALSWVDTRTAIQPVLGVSMKVPSSKLRQPSGGPSLHENLTNLIQAAAGNSRDKPEVHRAIKAHIEQAYQKIHTRDDLEKALETVGKGLRLDMEKSNVQDYLKSQRLFEDLFTGDGPTRFQDIWEVMIPIHMAPTTQISYGKKIGALISLLSGGVKVAMKQYLGLGERSDYLQVWREIFQGYAETQNRGDWIKKFLLNYSDLMYSDPCAFIRGIKGALTQHKKNGELTHYKALEAWAHITIGMRKDFDKFIDKIPEFWPIYKNVDSYLETDPEGILDEFAQHLTYVYSREKEQRSSVGTLHVMRTALQGQKRERTPEPEDERLSAKEKWERALKDAQEKEIKSLRIKRSITPEIKTEEPKAKKTKGDEGKNPGEKKQRSPSPRRRRSPSPRRPRSRSPRRGEERRRGKKSDYINQRRCPLYNTCKGYHSFFDCPLDKKERLKASADNCKRCGFPGHRTSECKSKQGCMECTRRGKDPKACDHPTLNCRHLFTEKGKWIGKYSDFPRSERKFIFDTKKKPESTRSKSKEFAPPANYEKKRAQSAAPSTKSERASQRSEEGREKK
jgi:hypothetical protein